MFFTSTTSYELASVVVLAGLLIGCDGKEAAKEEDATVRVFVTTPKIMEAVIERDYVADIRAIRHAELRSRFKGVLEAVSIDEGRDVKAGQVLFVVNSRALRQELLVARAATLGAEVELEGTLLELQNTKLLAEKNVVSQAELALAESKVATVRAKVEQAKAMAERAKLEVGFAEIKAPFDGVINRIPRRVGNALQENDLLTTITDTSEVYAYFRISEREYLEYQKVAQDDKPKGVTLRLADASAYPTEGVIDAIESEFDRETGTLTYRARFANSNRTLKHGSSGKVSLKSVIPDALIVPQKATVDVQGDVFVYVIDSGNVARMRKLAVKARLQDGFVIDRGLVEGERFVLEGVQKVKDGGRVEVITTPATAGQHTSPKGG